MQFASENYASVKFRMETSKYVIISQRFKIFFSLNEIYLLLKIEIKLPKGPNKWKRRMTATNTKNRKKSIKNTTAMPTVEHQHIIKAKMKYQKKKIEKKIEQQNTYTKYT